MYEAGSRTASAIRVSRLIVEVSYVTFFPGRVWWWIVLCKGTKPSSQQETALGWDVKKRGQGTALGSRGQARSWLTATLSVGQRQDNLNRPTNMGIDDRTS